MFHRRLHDDRDHRFKDSPLRYVSKINNQYLTTVKLPGSFRLAAGKQHLHCYCIFTGRLVETVFKSLSHSCGPELTRQGITLPLDDYSYRRRSLVLRSMSTNLTDSTLKFNIPTLVRPHPLYILLQVSRELCF